MSDNIKNDNQRIELSDTDLAKIAAALLGVEYPGDEYFDGTKETDSVSTVKVVSVENENQTKEETLEPTNEELPEVNYTQRLRSTPFRKQSFSAWQSARLRNFAKAGIISTEIEEENDDALQEELAISEEAIIVDNSIEPEEEGVITISDILGEDAVVMEHEPDLLGIDDEVEPDENAQEDTVATVLDETEDIEEGEIELTEEESETDNQLLDEEDSEEVNDGDGFDFEEESTEDDVEQIERLKNVSPIIPIVASMPAFEDSQNIDKKEEIEETKIEPVVPVAPKKVRKERAIVEEIREITVCEKKNKQKTQPPVMPEFSVEKPMYFAYIETKPKKIRRTSNAPHIIPTDSQPVEFSPKGGAYREI